MKQKRKLELVKLLPEKNGFKGNIFQDRTLHLKNTFSTSELDEYVVLQPGMYEDIFDKPLKKESKFNKLISVIKISYKDNKTRSIHRAFRGASAVDFNQNYAALTPSSIRLLCADEDPKSVCEVCLEKGCWLPFFLFHPNRALLSSTWAGVIGITISVISILISIFL